MFAAVFWANASTYQIVPSETNLTLSPFKEAEETLKSKVPPKANIAFGNGIVIKRARNNRLTIKYEEWEPENDSKEK